MTFDFETKTYKCNYVDNYNYNYKYKNAFSVNIVFYFLLKFAIYNNLRL